MTLRSPLELRPGEDSPVPAIGRQTASGLHQPEREVLGLLDLPQTMPGDDHIAIFVLDLERGKRWETR